MASTGVEEVVLATVVVLLQLTDACAGDVDDTVEVVSKEDLASALALAATLSIISVIGTS